MKNNRDYANYRQSSNAYYPIFCENDGGTPPEDMKRDIVKVLTHWKTT